MRTLRIIQKFIQVEKFIPYQILHYGTSFADARLAAARRKKLKNVFMIQVSVILYIIIKNVTDAQTKRERSKIYR